MNMGSPYLSDRSPDYLPWAGSVPVGSTYLHHEHLVAKYKSLLTFGLHYLFTWTPDDNWSPRNSMQIAAPNATDVSITPRSQGPIQGSMTIWGGEVKLSGRRLRPTAISATRHIDARNINACGLGQVIHSYGAPVQTEFLWPYLQWPHRHISGPRTRPEPSTTQPPVCVQLGQFARYPRTSGATAVILC